MNRLDQRRSIIVDVCIVLFEQSQRKAALKLLQENGIDFKSARRLLIQRKHRRMSPQSRYVLEQLTLKDYVR